MNKPVNTNKRKTSKSPKVRRKQKAAKAMMAVLSFFVVMFAVFMLFVNEKLDLIAQPDTPLIPQQSNINSSDIIYEEDEITTMTGVHDAHTINDFLYKWANNGGVPYSSKNVINVLLCGLDSDDALENGGRSDSIILLSLNKKTEQINMTSFYRDSWCYIEEIGGYGKINASYFYGGPAGLIDTVEKYFKINIDYYAAVDFSSFVEIINALGGVTVEVQEYEAEYINSTTVHTIEHGPAVTLDGYEALVFARIRKSDNDADVSRTRRQRLVIEAFVNRAKNASLSQLNDALDILLQHVKTDLTKMQIMSYATQALTKGWLNYELVQRNLSEEDIYATGYVGSQAVAFIEYPLAAQRLQNYIYGESNIVIDDKSVSYLSIASPNFN